DDTTLLETDDGGIAQVSNPATSPSDWTSKGGNLGAVELYSVAYDTGDNIIFGGAQDNGSNQQSAAGSTARVQFAGNDGALQAYDAAHDIRYNMQNDLSEFARSGSQIHLSNAPGADPFTGLDNTKNTSRLGTDLDSGNGKAGFTLTSFALNAV